MPSTAELQEEINRRQKALTQSENRAEMYFQQLVMGIHVRSDLKPFLDQVERNKGRSAERERCIAICLKESKEPNDLGDILAHRIRTLNA